MYKYINYIYFMINFQKVKRTGCDDKLTLKWISFLFSVRCFQFSLILSEGISVFGAKIFNFTSSHFLPVNNNMNTKCWKV